MLTIDYEGSKTQLLYMRWLMEVPDEDHKARHMKLPLLECYCQPGEDRLSYGLSLS